MQGTRSGEPFIAPPPPFLFFRYSTAIAQIMIHLSGHHFLPVSISLFLWLTLVLALCSFPAILLIDYSSPI